MGIAAVKGFYQSEESKEGVRAFNERASPTSRSIPETSGRARYR